MHWAMGYFAWKMPVVESHSSRKYHQKRNYGRMGNVKVMITIDSKPNKNFYEEGVQLVMKLGLLC